MSSLQTDANETLEDPAVTYANLIVRGWKTKPSELAKDKLGRQQLRAYANSVREAYLKALENCHNSPLALQMALDHYWEGTADVLFRSDRAAPTVFPFPLENISSPYPNDPYITQTSLFEHIIDTRMPPVQTFPGSSIWERLHAAFREAWIRRRLGRTFLSDIFYMMREIQMEQIVTLEAEWRAAGIVSDETDAWDNEIPPEVVPLEVQRLIDDDTAYRSRMAFHDSNENSSLFYGFPLGARIPVDSPNRRELYPVREITDEMVLDEMNEALSTQNWVRVRSLGNLGNDYLRHRKSSRQRSVKYTSQFQGGSSYPNYPSLPKELKVSNNDSETVRPEDPLPSKEGPSSESESFRETST